MSYWVAVVAKDAASHIRSTLTSLVDQDPRPGRLIVVDDGSKDATPEILSEFERKYPAIIHVVTLPDHGYDIRRVPANIN